MKTAISINWLKRAATVALFCAGVRGAQAAPPLTAIQDQLFRADGTAASGTLVITWKGFLASDRSNIPANSLRVPVSAGLIRLKLTPTTTAVTAASYTVQYLIDGMLTNTEVWSVPPSAAPLTISMVRETTTSSSGATAAADSTIQIADVLGLSDALTARPTKGAAYTTGQLLVPDANGDLSGLSGTPDQCVRGDGSLGACGMVVTFVDVETPGGTIDGINTAFTLAQAPAPAASLLLFRNGLLQRAGVDFSLSGAAVTFLAGSIPQPGDLLQANYRVTQ
jgi:hypothetical protein